MSIKPLLPGALGFGTAPLGNMFRAIPDEEAAATVEAAWDQGIRYFDTAPFYGAGLSEIRLGASREGPFVVASPARTVTAGTRFPVARRAARYVVVWVVELPPNSAGEVAEVRVRAR